MTDIFNNVSIGVLHCLEKREISEEFLGMCRKALTELKAFQQTAMQYPDSINALKLFSASDTCYLVLQKSISELEQAKVRGENPTTLEKLQDVLLYIGSIGKELDVIFNKKVRVEATTIRKETFELQEKAEGLDLLDKIDIRVRSLSGDIATRYISKIEV
jgi:hypothetical protein